MCLIRRPSYLTCKINNRTLNFNLFSIRTPVYAGTFRHPKLGQSTVENLFKQQWSHLYLHGEPTPRPPNISTLIAIPIDIKKKICIYCTAKMWQAFCEEIPV